MPKQSAPSSRARGKRASTGRGGRAAANAGNKRHSAAAASVSEADGPLDQAQGEGEDEDEDEVEGEQGKTIPAALLTRLLHEFFAKEGTRLTKDANTAVARYMDVFIREAIARSVAERDDSHGFLEVEDLEKIAPQLLLDM